jgi:trimeric autotransporter adhesin
VASEGAVGHIHSVIPIHVSTPFSRWTASPYGSLRALLVLLILAASCFAQTSFTPSTLNFGNQAVGVVSIPKAAFFKNTQTVALTIGSIAISGGTAPADYAWGGTCPISPNTLGAGQSCSIPVVFTPSATGSRTSSLIVTDNASNSPQSIALTGNGVPPVTLSVSTLGFGNQAEGSTSAAKTVTLKNVQTIPLTISGISIAGTDPADYALSGNCPTSPSTLGAGLSCSILVTFTPSALGSRTATLTVSDSAANSPQSSNLTGSGIAPVTVSTSTLTFASRILGTTSGAILVNVGNHLSTSLLFSSITTSGDFALASNTCGSSIGAGLSCALGVTFSPTAVGARQGTLSIYDNAFGSPTLISLNGTGNDNGLTSIAVTPVNASIAAGTTQQFIATGKFKGGSTQILTPYVAWTSSSTTVAAVTSSGMSTGLTTGTSLIGATLTGISGSTTLIVTPPVLSSIIVTPANASIPAGNSQQFTATGTYSDGSAQNLTSSSTWTSSVPSVVTIQAGGLASSATVGTSTISAALNGITGSTNLSVTVPVLVSIALTPSTASIAAGNAQAFSATGTYSDGSKQTLTTSATWTSSIPAVATVVPGGIATGVAPGNANLSATVNGVTGSAALTVTAPLLTSIAVTPLTASITSGSTQQFAALGNFSDGSTQNLSNSATWSSSATTVSTISSAGLATAVATGSTNLSATLNGVTGSANLTVTAPSLVSIALTPGSATIAAGGTQPFTATGTYSDNSTQDLTSTATWSSSAPAIATVGNVSGSYGAATGTNVGVTTITAAANGITGFASLTVTAGFVLTGSLTTPRFAHTATMLNNGMVLLAGGSDSSGNPLVSAELYSPAAGTFSSTGTLNVARINPTAALLNNGIVLIIGGFDSTGSPLASAELYNPASSTFTLTGSLNAPRLNPTATLLSNGTVLVTGGSDSSGNPLASTELYSPATGSFTFTGNLNVARLKHSATLLNNGLVLIAAGSDATGNPQASAELYDPVAGTFTATGSLNAARTLQSATLLNNGTVLIAGGTDSTAAIATSEIYDPVAATFTVTGSLTTPRDLHTATLLNNGTVLIGGGSGSAGTLASAELYDPATGLFTPTGSLSNARSQQTSTLLPSGSVLIAGGANTGVAVAAAEQFEPASLTPTNLVAISLTPSSGAVALNAPQSFTAVGTFSDNSTQQLASLTWSSSNPAVLSITNDVSDHGVGYSLAAGTATVNACAGSVCGSAAITVGLPVLTSVAITPANPTVAAGLTTQLFATGTYSDGSTQDLTASVTWTSLSPSVATISAGGLASGLTSGTAGISATMMTANVSGSATLTVTAPILVSIAIAPGNSSIAAGYTEQFAAAGTFTDGGTQDLTSTATWSSSVPAVATIPAGGLATAITVGTTSIGASVNGIAGTTTLTVAPPVLLSIAVTPANPLVPAGDTQQFSVVGTFSDGSMQNLTSIATWSSSVPSIAAINSSGLATATTQGTSIISASANGFTGSTALTVAPPALVSIAVTPGNATFSVGNTRQFKAVGTFSDGSTQNLTSTATWTSSSTSVATISNTSGSQGLATAAAVGTTTMVSSSGSFSGSATVTVTPALTKGTLTLYTTSWAGLSRMYYLYIPKVVAPTPAMIVFLHATSTLTTVPLSSPGPWETIAEQYGTLVAWPISTWDTAINTWHWDCDGCESGFSVPPDDSGYLRSVIMSLQSQYGISTGQTFVAGMSSGGYMAQRVGMEQSDIIAAIAPVAGAQYIQPLGSTFVTPVVPNPLSVYRINGDIDPVVPYCGGVKGYWAGVRAFSPSMDSDADFWAGAYVNACTISSQTQPLCTNGGPTAGVNGQDETGCKGGTEVLFEREVGVGHQWVAGTEAKIWAFFQTHGR